MPFGISEMLIPALMGGASMLGGFLGKKGDTTQQTTAPSWTPDQQGIQGDLFNWLKSRMQPGGGADFTAQKNVATGNINNTYSDISDRMNNSLTARGFGGSGKVGTNLQKVELGRAGAISANEGSFADMKRQQDNFDISTAMDYAFKSPGQNQNSTTTGGGGVGNAVGGGLQTSTFLYALNHMMGAGGGAPPPGMGTIDRNIY